MVKPLFFVVDDDPAYARLIQAHLQSRYSADVRVFYSGEAFLEHTAMKPKVIVLDYNLGNDGLMNGKDVWIKIKQIALPAKVIMMSAQGEGKIVLELVQMGLREYVMKDEEALTSLDDIIDEYLSASE